MADLITRGNAATGATPAPLQEGTGQLSTGTDMMEASYHHVDQWLLLIFEFLQ